MNSKFSHPTLALMAALTCMAAAQVEFNRDIRPILTKECTACHGGVKAAGGLSFIYRELALSQGDSGKRTIVPGKPEESEMIRRMRHSDPDEVMPILTEPLYMKNNSSLAFENVPCKSQ